MKDETKYQNKYRKESHRYSKWDYSLNGRYFITFVTQGRKCCLGQVVNDEMQLSTFGQIVADEWIRSFDIRAELFIDKWVIMPNHIHAIVVLNNDVLPVNHSSVKTHGRVSLHVKRNRPIRLPKSISSFIAGFKSAVNTGVDDYIDRHQLNMVKYNRHNHFFQSNYYDHIIRNQNEYSLICEYIENNPRLWYSDQLNELTGRDLMESTSHYGFFTQVLDSGFYKD